MFSKVAISSAVFVGVANAAAIGRRQELTSGPSSVSFPVPSSSVAPRPVSSPLPNPSGVPAGCPSVILPTNSNLNGTVNGTNPVVVGDGTTLNSTTNVNSTTDGNSTPDDNSTNDGQGETWGQWGTNIGNYYSNIYGSPDDVPGLPQYKKRSPQSETWGQWGEAIGNYYANLYGSPDDVPGLPQFKRSPETWGQWGDAIGNYYANLYGSPDDVPGLPWYKRQFDAAPVSKRAPAPKSGRPHHRRAVIQPADAIALIRTMQIDVQTKMLDAGRGDSIMTVISQLETLVVQANTAGSDLNAILAQAQDIVNNA